MQSSEENLNKIVTIPNILSLFRLCLIPVIAVLYRVKNAFAWTTSVVILSGVTDLVDGFIARRFNMVSHVGRILDPLADKLTQIAVMFCLLGRFNYMIIPLFLLIAKELISGVVSFTILKLTGNTMNSKWHGKLATVLLYLMMIVHLFWYNITAEVSYSLVAVCCAFIILSFVLYLLLNIKALISIRKNNQKEKIRVGK